MEDDGKGKECFAHVVTVYLPLQHMEDDGKDDECEPEPVEYTTHGCSDRTRVTRALD
jgi:hypothetical protein